MLKKLTMFGSFDSSVSGWYEQAQVFPQAIAQALIEESGVAGITAQAIGTVRVKGGTDSVTKSLVSMPSAGTIDDQKAIGSSVAQASVSSLLKTLIDEKLKAITGLPVSALISAWSSQERAILNNPPGLTKDPGGGGGDFNYTTLDGFTYDVSLVADLANEATASSSYSIVGEIPFPDYNFKGISSRFYFRGSYGIAGTDFSFSDTTTYSFGNNGTYDVTSTFGTQTQTSPVITVNGTAVTGQGQTIDIGGESLRTYAWNTTGWPMSANAEWVSFSRESSAYWTNDKWEQVYSNVFGPIYPYPNCSVRLQDLVLDGVVSTKVLEQVNAITMTNNTGGVISAGTLIGRLAINRGIYEA